MRDLGLTNKVVLITGGGGVLGSAFARGFADSGAKVAIGDFVRDKAEKVAADLKAHGADAIGVGADVTKEDLVTKMVADVVDRFGTIDILVNAAAVQIYPGKEITEILSNEWDSVLGIGLKGIYMCSKQVVPVMKKNGRGKIVNIASIAGHRGLPGGSAYSAAKGGVVNLTRQMGVELGKYHINVNSISPGFTPNRLTSVNQYAGKPDDSSQTLPAGVNLTVPPLGRNGDIEDYVGPVLFLASTWADYITGADIPVEGGRMAAR
ncbi:MAG: SDR family oxidoreductase [Deltaproteobacteria bacterium]|nr:SDR family oxidoreductase [Deltaproteobacteria bacterium]